ncbi:MAG: FkbM family methyltransferase [Nitrosomonadales bacterium]|nr:FkbM family methyltransferase [Nitrosomonadales bacterium]
MRRVTTRLKHIPGAILLINPLRQLFARYPDCVTVTDYDGGLTATLCLNEHMQSQIFWYGYYSRDIVLLLDKLLKPGMTVVDVGANIGEISMAAAQRTGASGAVFAFEPMSSLYARLQQHLDANRLHQVTAVKCGLSDQAGSAQLYSASQTFHDGTEHKGLGTLYSSDTRATPTEIIDIDTLDSFAGSRNLARIDLIKVDVEGAELPVLKGSKNVIMQFRPYLIIEIQHDTSEQAGYRAADILEFLGQFGYRFHTIGRKAKLTGLTAETLAAFQNVLCVPPERSLPEN